MANKFKVGDKVMVRPDLEIDHEYGGLHLWKNMAEYRGFKAEVQHAWSDGRYGLKDCGIVWAEEMLTLADMTKSDLKSGMIVEMRCGDRYFVMRGENMPSRSNGLQELAFMNKNNVNFGSRFNEDLTHVEDKRWDIVKVYQMDWISDLTNIGRHITNCDDWCKLIWERPVEVVELTLEEIASKLGMDVKSLRIKD